MDLSQIWYYFKTVISTLAFVIISIKICRGFIYFFELFKQKLSGLLKHNVKQEKISVSSIDLKNDLRDTFLNFEFLNFILLPLAVYFFSEHLSIVFIIIALHHVSTCPDKNHVLEIKKLHPGHGAALAYYKNYLEMILTERFSERIDRFNSENMITVPKKLFILVPQSCRVHRYLDSIEQENIERCRELPDEQISHAGIKNRTYNITIYDINGLRMAVEFAQPLKALYLLYEKGLFTDEEMFYQRKVFVKTLKTFLLTDQYKYFEVVDYDDSVMTIEKALLRSYYDSFQYIYDLETV